eukprot:365998-Chlamydomonas_euryale.AAC.3
MHLQLATQAGPCICNVPTKGTLLCCAGADEDTIEATVDDGILVRGVSQAGWQMATRGKTGGHMTRVTHLRAAKG